MSGTFYFTNNSTVTGQAPIGADTTTASPFTITITVPDANNELIYTLPNVGTTAFPFPTMPEWKPLPRAPDAELKARRLVERLLTPEQLRTWDLGKWVDIPSAKHSGRIYRLKPLEHDENEPGIDVYERGEYAAFVCLHVGPGLDLLRDDRLVAKVLLCRYAEEEIETVGNWRFMDGHRVDHRRAPVNVPTEA